MTHKRRDPKPTIVDYSTNRVMPISHEQVLTCSSCLGYYLPNADGRRAHVVVFDHQPDELIDIGDEDIIDGELIEDPQATPPEDTT